MLIYVGFSTGQHGHIGLCDDTESRYAAHKFTRARRNTKIH